MAYVELKKIYYQDMKQYHEEYQRRVSSPDTLVLDFEIKGKPAFLVQTPELFSFMLKILRADKKVQNLNQILPGAAIKQFTQRCLVDEIILTNKIEGVHSTRREILSVLNKIQDSEKRERVKQRFFGLVNMYLKLQEKASIPLDSCQDIRALYDEIVLPEVAKEDPKNVPDGTIFRKELASITTATDKEIHRGAYPESAIIDGIEKALAFLKDDSIEILFRIAIFHYFLEYIHPFYDGNGRLGRFIVSYMLSKNFEPLLAYRVSYTIQENINEYYKAFRICNDPKNMGDVTPFALIMLRLIAESSERLVNALEERNTVLQRYVNTLHYLAPSGNRAWSTYFILVQAALFSERGISTKELEDTLQVSYFTVKKELEPIEKLGLLKKVKFERENYYSLDLDKADALLSAKADSQVPAGETDS